MKNAVSCIFLAFLIAIPVAGLHEQEKQSGKMPPARSKAQAAPKTDAGSEKKLPDEIAAFIDNVRSAPPEFAADLLIRLAESNRITDPVRKRELLEEAFRTAQQAQQPYKRVYSSMLYPLDTRSGYLGYAFELDLDATSLRCKAINALLKVDKQKARALFAEIPKPELKPISCEDSLVYDLSAFYSTLTNIAQTAFTPKEIARKDHLAFVESHISNMVSSAQIASVIHVLLALQVSALDLETLTHTFSGALANIAEDDRAFLYTLSSRRTSATALSAILKLLARCQEQNISSDDVVRAYRAYLVKQLSGTRCADTYGRAKREISGLMSAFDDKVRPFSVKNVLALSSEEIKPAQVVGGEKAYMYWQSPKAAEMLDRVRQIQFGDNKEEVSDDVKRSADWLAEVEDFLKHLANWRKEDEKSEEDYFHQKSLLYTGLLKLMPSSNTRDEVMRSYVAFLNEFDLQRGSRLEWFWHASYLTGSNPNAKQIAPVPLGEAHAKLLETMGLTKNPVLFLYAEWRKLSTAK